MVNFKRTNTTQLKTRNLIQMTSQNKT